MKIHSLHFSLATFLLAGCLWAENPAGPAPAIAPGEQAWQKLLDGNQRFMTNGALHPDQSPERRLEVSKGQKPFAIVLTCADSRLSPEILFDQGLGDLFVVRNAGNLLDDHTLGSIEYAVEHLHVSLLVVLGHSQCGAVSAAVSGGEAPGHLHSVVEAIAPAVEQTKGLAGDKVDNAVRANAKRMAESAAGQDPLLAQAVKSGHLKVVAARYDLASGRVEPLP